MEDQKLELPEPAAYVTRVSEGRILMLPRASLDTSGMAPLFTAEQMLACYRKGREDAAKICDERVTDCEESHACDGDVRWLVYANHARRLAAAIRKGSGGSGQGAG